MQTINYLKKEVTEALRGMIRESLDFIKAHLAWLHENGDKHPDSEQVFRQVANHLMILHPSFKLIRRVFKKDELAKILSENQLDLIEEIYIEGLKDGTMMSCDCDFCIDHEVYSEDVELTRRK